MPGLKMEAKVGEHNFKVVLLRESRAAKNSLGEDVESWATFAEYWAKREWLSAAQSTTDGGFRASGLAVRFTINGKPALTMKDRVRLKTTGQTFNVSSLIVENYETIVEGNLVVT